MAGAFVCASLGIVPTVRHADYIGSWLEVLREDNRAIVRAASAASKAADHILGFQSVKQQRAETSHATDDQEAGWYRFRRNAEPDVPFALVRPCGCGE